ncbi:MAG TPA: hypothetical protein PKA95_17415 [Thermomicrobiales bacterium]|nr:hypothetical protein [Thermomicrobiales bacterium]
MTEQPARVGVDYVLTSQPGQTFIHCTRLSLRRSRYAAATRDVRC